MIDAVLLCAAAGVASMAALIVALIGLGLDDRPIADQAEGLFGLFSALLFISGIAKLAELFSVYCVPSALKCASG